MSKPSPLRMWRPLLFVLLLLPFRTSDGVPLRAALFNGESHGLRHNQRDWTVRMQRFFDHHLRRAPDWMQKGIPRIDRERQKVRFRQAATAREA